MYEQYNDWLENVETHTYTRSGKERMPTKTDLCNIAVKAWDNISTEIITKSFRVCGQVADVNIDEIVCFRDGRCAASGKHLLEDLMKLEPNDIDYASLKKKSNDSQHF